MESTQESQPVEPRLSFSTIEAISQLLREYGAEAITDYEYGGGALQEFDFVRRVAQLIAEDA